jgi:predicted outer membrane repeat protein
MKKYILLAVILVLVIQNNFTQTSISGGAVSGKWVKANSPYLIKGAIMIANATTLAIEPGVTVEFQGSYKFLVLGQLLAIGSIKDTITFTAKDTTTGWLGIRFDKTASTNDSSKFYYCKFTYGKATDNNERDGGAIYINGFSKVSISHSKFSDCYTSGIGGAINCIGGSSPIIVYNLFTSNIAGFCGAIASGSAGNKTIISNNVFLNNVSINSSISYGGAIGCWGEEIINNNIFYNNKSNSNDYSGGAIYCGSTSSSYIYNNIFANNSAPNKGGGAIFCYGTPTISNNKFSNNSSLKGGAIYCTGASPKIINNTFSNNIASYGGVLYCTGSSSPNIINSVMWDNNALVVGQQIYLDDENSDPNFTYCNIQGGLSNIGLNNNIFFIGTFIHNIDKDPHFVNPSLGSGLKYNGLNSDLSLQSNSPCINSGNQIGIYPSFDINGDVRIVDNLIDIGAYEYDKKKPIPLKISYNKNDASKTNIKDGVIELIVSGGKAPYKYLWNTGDTTKNIDSLAIGNYSVIVTDSAKNSITTKITISFAGISKFSISGNVFASTGMLSNGLALLFKQVQNSYIPVNYSEIINGVYSFPSIDSGIYILCALPDSNEATKFAPTYYFSESSWEMAHILPVDGKLFGVDIQMIPLQTIVESTGFIGGHVEYTDSSAFETVFYNKLLFHGLNNNNHVQTATNPAANVPVVLFNSDNKPLAWSLTNSNGNFNFSNLPYAKYKINAQKPGYTLNNTSDIELNDKISSIDKVVFQITKNNITLNIVNNEITNNSIKIYPNPVQNKLFLKLNPGKNSILSITIYNSQGQVGRIINFTLSPSVEQTIVIPTNYLENGLYFGKISGTINKQFKFIKFTE